MSRRGHWSDSALHSAPAYKAGPCDCGGLDLAAYARYVAITALVPTPGSLACFVEDGILPCSVEAEQAPPFGASTSASTPDLKGSHDGGAVLGRSDGMDFDNAGMTTIGDRKPLTAVQSIARNVPPHKTSPRPFAAGNNSGLSGDAK